MNILNIINLYMWLHFAYFIKIGSKNMAFPDRISVLLSTSKLDNRRFGNDQSSVLSSGLLSIAAPFCMLCIWVLVWFGLNDWSKLPACHFPPRFIWQSVSCWCYFFHFYIDRWSIIITYLSVVRTRKPKFGS